MVASSEGERKRKITRRMDARRKGRSVITVGEVEVEIIPVSNRGHAGWQVVMPEGGKIVHRKAGNDSQSGSVEALDDQNRKRSTNDHA